MGLATEETATMTDLELILLVGLAIVVLILEADGHVREVTRMLRDTGDRPSE